MRAAFLQSADPIVLLHCLKYYEKVWHSEVDKLYVLFNAPFTIDIVEATKDYVLSLPNTEWIYAPSFTGGASIPHGLSLSYLTSIATEDYILWIEDDSIIFKKGVVDGYFKEMEDGKCSMLGSPRMSCDARWAEICRTRFNLNYEGLGDKGPNFWPCFFFAKRSDLLKTDMNFKPRFFLPNEYIKPLNYTVSETDQQMGGDTFVWGSIQMRDITNNSVHEIPQYHSMPNWEYWYNANMFVWDGNCPWIHFGSLSSGLQNVLLASDMVPLGNKYMGSSIKSEYPILNSEAEKQEYEHRFYWWDKAWHYAKGRLKNVPEFLTDYGQAITVGKIKLKLDVDRLDLMDRAYRSVIGNLL